MQFSAELVVLQQEGEVDLADVTLAFAKNENRMNLKVKTFL